MVTLRRMGCTEETPSSQRTNGDCSNEEKKGSDRLRARRLTSGVPVSISKEGPEQRAYTFICHREQMPCSGDLSGWWTPGSYEMPEGTEARGRGPVPAQLHKMHTRRRAGVQAGLQASSLVQAVSLGSICPEG